MRAFILFLAAVSSSAFGFEYFRSDIDYWHQKERGLEARQGNIEKQDKKLKPKFDWQKQLDPQNEEFFREGDYLPPKPFMEVARDPSDRNIKNWLVLMEKKNNLRMNLQEKMQSYIRRNSSKMGEKSIEIVRSTSPRLEKIDPNYKRFRFRLYFHSQCPHCLKMMETMKQLSQKGFYVEIRQIDTDRKAIGNLSNPVIQATEQELKERKITSWPVLFAADVDVEKVYRLAGYRSLNEVFDALRGLDENRRG